MRVSDLVRDYIRTNIAPSYLPAITWNEDQSPYDNENAKIIFTKQTGRAVDAYVRQADVDILLFSAKNANLSDLDSLYADAELVIEYIKANFVISEDLRITITQDITGPYNTSQNRYFYRLSVLTYSE
tara:strand:+ start:46 stop:429 length:384 start_codon:yes stop_codon:yes gene_type:complete